MPLMKERCGSKPPDGGGGDQPAMSFRDKLMGNKRAPPPKPRMNLLEQGLVKIELIGGNRLFPNVIIEDKMFEELCNPWQEALVIKLLGKTLGYRTMLLKLQNIWKLQGAFDLMEVDNGYYMVKFDLPADRDTVMEGGPWMIFDHYLAVSTWSPDFVSSTAKVDKTLVWVRFPGMNLVYYDENLLLAMASAIGRPIKLDEPTLKVQRGRFARVCVEIDLTQPVVGKICIRDCWYSVAYEGLHMICSKCGCYGHFSRNCNAPVAEPVILTPPSPTVSNTIPTVHVQNGEARTSDAGINASAISADCQNIFSTEGPTPIFVQPYGESLVAVKRRNNNSKTNKEGIKKTAHQSSTLHMAGTSRDPPRKEFKKRPRREKEHIPKSIDQALNLVHIGSHTPTSLQILTKKNSQDQNHVPLPSFTTPAINKQIPTEGCKELAVVETGTASRKSSEVGIATSSLVRVDGMPLPQDQLELNPSLHGQGVCALQKSVGSVIMPCLSRSSSISNMVSGKGLVSDKGMVSLDLVEKGFKGGDEKVQGSDVALISDQHFVEKSARGRNQSCMRPSQSVCFNKSSRLLVGLNPK